MFSIVFYLLPGPGTSPIRFVLKIRAILKYLCVRSSDVVFYGRQNPFLEVSLASPSRRTHLRKAYQERINVHHISSYSIFRTTCKALEHQGVAYLIQWPSAFPPPCHDSRFLIPGSLRPPLVSSGRLLVSPGSLLGSPWVSLGFPLGAF